MKQKFALGNVRQGTFSSFAIYFFIFLLILFVDGSYAFVNRAQELIEIELQASQPVSQLITQPDVDVPISPLKAQSEVSFVGRVVDGDTVELKTGEKVRYIGIDTPETAHPTKGVECYGKIASEKNAELVAGKEVRLEKDVSETDRYGRLLRYVHVIEESTDSAEIFVNEYLVREGFAKASSYPPDIKYQDLFREAEAEARVLQKGLWGEGC